jgi:hypothetical protein
VGRASISLIVYSTTERCARGTEELNVPIKYKKLPLHAKSYTK